MVESPLYRRYALPLSRSRPSKNAEEAGFKLVKAIIINIPVNKMA
jgi:hypothetical protein